VRSLGLLPVLPILSSYLTPFKLFPLLYGRQLTIKPRQILYHDLWTLFFSGSSLGIQGSGIDHNDMSVGQTRVAKLKVRPAPNSQAAQFQETVTTNTSQMFQLVAAGGAVCDLRMRATITHDARPTNNSVTVTGPAVVGNFYYLALDNNAGGTGSVGNVWVPPPSIITIT